MERLEDSPDGCLAVLGTRKADGEPQQGKDCNKLGLKRQRSYRSSDSRNPDKLPKFPNDQPGSGQGATATGTGTHIALPTLEETGNGTAGNGSGEGSNVPPSTLAVDLAEPVCRHSNTASASGSGDNATSQVDSAFVHLQRLQAAQAERQRRNNASANEKDGPVGQLKESPASGPAMKPAPQPTKRALVPPPRFAATPSNSRHHSPFHQMPQISEATDWKVDTRTVYLAEMLRCYSEAQQGFMSQMTTILNFSSSPACKTTGLDTAAVQRACGKALEIIQNITTGASAGMARPTPETYMARPIANPGYMALTNAPLVPHPLQVQMMLAQGFMPTPQEPTVVAQNVSN